MCRRQLRCPTYVYLREGKKGKVATVQAIKQYGGVELWGPRILKLVSTQRLVIIFRLRPFYYKEISPQLGNG